MKQLDVYNFGKFCGTLSFDGTIYTFQYDISYDGEPISLTMPCRADAYSYQKFPPFFDGLLPEGAQLEGLLRIKKIDRDDFMAQLSVVGADMIGTVTVASAIKEIPIPKSSTQSVVS